MKVAIYARVSSEGQEKRGTIGSQVEALRARMAADGHEIVAEFLDDGYSGARLDRPGLDALRDAAEAGVVETVWCLTPDRLARSYAYQMLVLDELDRLGCKVHFTDAPEIDDDPQARLLTQMQGVIAEYERAKIAERHRRGKLYRVRAGEAIFWKVPYGYRRVPRTAEGPARLEIYEPEAEIVRQIFDDYVSGGTLGPRDLPPPLRARRAVPERARRVGHLDALGADPQPHLHGLGRVVSPRDDRPAPPGTEPRPPAAAPPRGLDPRPGPGDHHRGDLRGRATRQARQLRLQPAAHHPGTVAAARTRRLRPLRREEPDAPDRAPAPTAARASNRYYCCPNHDAIKAGGPEQRCTERRIRADELDAFVFDQVREILLRPDVLLAGEQALVSREPAPDDELLDAQLARLTRRVDEATAERRRITDLYQAGHIDMKELNRRATEVDARRRAARHPADRAHRPTPPARRRQPAAPTRQRLRQASRRRDRHARLRPTSTTATPDRRTGPRPRLAGRAAPPHPARRPTRGRPPPKST